MQLADFPAFKPDNDRQHEKPRSIRQATLNQFLDELNPFHRSWCTKLADGWESLWDDEHEEVLRLVPFLPDFAF